MLQKYQKSTLVQTGVKSAKLKLISVSHNKINSMPYFRFHPAHIAVHLKIGMFDPNDERLPSSFNCGLPEMRSSLPSFVGGNLPWISAVKWTIVLSLSLTHSPYEWNCASLVIERCSATMTRYFWLANFFLLDSSLVVVQNQH